MPTVSEPHRDRQAAESFGADAQRYDRARPSYPQALIDAIVEGSPGRDVLDAGCGTGIVARQLRAAGCRVLGVDADPRMVALARQTGIDAEVAKLEDWDPAGRTFDAVVAGQMWHWVDTVAGAAKAAEALRPGGRLAVFWNAFQPPSEVAKAFAEVQARILPTAPDLWSKPVVGVYESMADRAAEGIRQAAFGTPDRWRFPWERDYTRDEWLDWLPTGGLWSRLTQAEQREMLDAAAAAVDALGGSFTMGYTTVAVTALRV